MKKVYLAKSNRVNPENTMRVREILKAHKCEIKEFAGGTYSNKDVIESDILLVIPESVTGPTEAIIGRGLYGQIEDFAMTNGIKNAYIVFNLLSNDFQVCEVVRIEKLEKAGTKEQWINYGKVFFREQMKGIDTVIELKIDEML